MQNSQVSRTLSVSLIHFDAILRSHTDTSISHALTLYRAKLFKSQLALTQTVTTLVETAISCNFGTDKFFVGKCKKYFIRGVNLFLEKKLLLGFLLNPLLKLSTLLTTKPWYQRWSKFSKLFLYLHWTLDNIGTFFKLVHFFTANWKL